MVFPRGNLIILGSFIVLFPSDLILTIYSASLRKTVKVSLSEKEPICKKRSCNEDEKNIDGKRRNIYDLF